MAWDIANDGPFNEPTLRTVAGQQGAMERQIAQVFDDLSVTPDGGAVPWACVANAQDEIIRIVTAYLSTTPASPQPALAVKGLGEWRRGYCDDRVTIEQASTGFGSIYQVRVLDGIVWLDFPDQRKSEFGSDVEAAKSAAQADYETRIRSALVSPPPSGEVEALLREACSFIDDERERNPDNAHPNDRDEIEERNALRPKLIAKIEAALSIAPATADGWLVDRAMLAEAAADPSLPDGAVRQLCSAKLGEITDEVLAWVETVISAAPAATGGR